MVSNVYTPVAERMGWVTRARSGQTWEKVREPLGRVGFLSPGGGKAIAPDVFVEHSFQGVAG